MDFNNNPGTALRLNLINDRTIEKIYPNQLKDLKRHQHDIMIASKKNIVNGQIRSKFKHLLEIIEQKENSQMIYFQVHGTPREIIEYVGNLLASRQIHMVLDKGLVIQNSAPKLMTYEETGICAIAVFPEETIGFNLHKVINFCDLSIEIFKFF